jgi:cysteine desulfurase
MLNGGGQEFGMRGGTENVPYIVGMGVAAADCARHLARNNECLERMRHRLLTRLQDSLGAGSVHVNGPTDPAHRLPNTLSVGFAGGIHSGKLLEAVRDQVAASAGATCHSASGPVSAVLLAMQVPTEIARSTLRLSLGPATTADEVDRAAILLGNEIKKQRGNLERSPLSCTIKKIDK